MTDQERLDKSRAYQREYKRRTRAEARLSILQVSGPDPGGAQAASTSMALAAPPPGTNGGGLALAGGPVGGSVLTRQAWLTKRTQLAMEILDIGTDSLRVLAESCSIDKAADAIRLVSKGVAMLDQLVHTLAPEEDSAQHDLVRVAHQRVLSSAAGLRAAQELMILQAQEISKMRMEAPPI